MSQERMVQAALGVSMVVLAYALYQHFKPQIVAAKAAGTLPFGSSVINPDVGYGYDPYNPGEFIASGDLVRGTIADYYTGQTAGAEIPTTSGLINSAIHDFYTVR